MTAELRIKVDADVDVVTARQTGRELAIRLGFSRGDQALIATAISELARNILQYAGKGEILLRELREGDRRGLCLTACDDGPGIPDVARAMLDGFSTSGGLGLGLPGVKRLMDELKVDSVIGSGTRIEARKWVP